MTKWSFEPVWDSYAAVLIIAVGLMLLLLVRPSGRRVQQRQQRILLALRMAVVLLITVAMLRPTHVSSTVRRQAASLLVLLDISQSMQLPDTAGDRSRWEAQQATLQQAEQVLRELDEDLDVKVYAYDSRLHRLKMDRSGIQLPGAPTGEQTDIGTSVYEAVRREVGRRVAGVVVLGDGAQNAFQPQVDLQQAGREVARLGAPLYAVAFGPASDAAQGRDVAVENMPDHYTVFVKNELVVSGLLRVRGFVNQEIPVELVVRDEEGREEVRGPVAVTARQDDQQLRIELPYVPERPGRYTLTLRAAEQPGETVVENNQLTAFLTVLEGGLRVLYVEGELRWEAKFARHALDASPDMDVDMVLIDQQQRQQWPIDLGELLEETPYDVILIGDVDAEALGEENLNWIAQAVERGKGLMMAGGFHSFGPGGYRATSLAEVLPVVMDRFEQQEFGAPLRQDLHIEGPVQMVPVRPHPILQLGPTAENDRLWEQLPALQGANKFFQLKELPGVEVLAATSQGAPLLVAGEYGGGRVLASAVDSTWRWAMRGYEEPHRRFWRQAILWLARRDDLVQDEVWVKLPQRRYPRGANVLFTAGARTGAGDPLPDATLDASLIRPDGSREPVQLSAGAEAQQGTIDDLDQAGRYSIEVVGKDQTELLGRARVDFEVLDRNAELANPAADPDQLIRLAAMTRDYDGRACAPEQLVSVLQQIQRRPPDLDVEVQTRWQLADTTADAWLFFLAVVGLLAAEWTLRKKWGLV